ncbi:cell division protein FtsX [Crocinitomix algicola]|uniref:cell division protein FtsX n=1 Tax=Crocinitomix algicola TaxID=1740263 RepID=UPI00082EC7B4|nr:permease-like cell division protein FtsX [Crocinitomix algicola]
MSILALEMGRIANRGQKGLKTAYVATIVGIVIVLFILGTVSWFVLGLNNLKDDKIQSFEIDLFFDNSVNNLELGIIEEEIAQKDYSHTALYRSAEEAWDKIKEDIGGGDTALAVLDNENPLNQSIVMTLNKSYFKLDSMKWIEAELMREYEGRILEVSYPETIFSEYNQGIQKAVYFMLFLSALLLFVAIAMINNTIRLALFSKRFLIKTMQLVGATPGFIRRPFFMSAIGQGLLSGLIAGTMVLGLIFLLQTYNPMFLNMTDLKLFFIVLGGIIVFGILITLTSTYFALRKYLRLNLDKLY